MSILDRKYIVTANLNDGTVEAPSTMEFFNTDTGIANIYLKLIKKNSDGVDEEIAANDLIGYTITLKVVKPKTIQVRTLNAIANTDTEVNAPVKFELDSEFTNQGGTVRSQIFISYGDEKLTFDEFTFRIKLSIITDLNDELTSNPELSIFEDLIAKTQKVNNINDINISETETYSNAKIEEKFTGVNAQFNTITQDTTNMQQQVNNLVLGAVGDGNNAEIVQARGKFDTLNDRLNDIDVQMGYEKKTINLSKNSTFTVPSGVENQTVALLWDGDIADGDSLNFTNAANSNANYTLPYTMATGDNQFLPKFGIDVTAYAYNNKATEDAYGCVFGWVHITVAEGDTLTLKDGYFFDTTGNKVTSLSNPSQTGYYVFWAGIIVSTTGYINRGNITCSVGGSTIDTVVLQSKAWFDENNSNLTLTGASDVINYFPYERIGTLSPSSTYTPEKQANALINNETTITQITSTLDIVSGTIIKCTLGSLTFTYKVLKGTDVGGSVVIKPWVDYKWACIGDSYTDTTINANYKYEQIISDLTGIQVQMLGVGGTGWWKGYDTNTSYKFRASQVNVDTDIVTIFGSINDWKYYQGDNPLTIGEKTDKLSDNKNTLCAYINDVFDTLESTVPTAQIIVFSPMYYHGLSSRVNELFNAVKICTENRGYEYVDMLNIGWLRIESNSSYAEKYCTDYSETSETFGHPNNDAHKQFIAPKFFNKLKDYLPISKDML